MANYYILQPINDSTLAYTGACTDIISNTEESIIGECIEQILSGTVFILNLKYTDNILDTSTFIQINPNKFCKILPNGIQIYTTANLLKDYRKIDLSSVMSDRNTELENLDDTALLI